MPVWKDGALSSLTLNMQTGQIYWATSLFDLSLADLTQVKSLHFGLSTYLDQSSTKRRSKYVLRPYFCTQDFRSAKSLHFLA